jgi:hypothetical protein
MTGTTRAKAASKPDAKHKTILAGFGLAFAVMIYGVIPRRSLLVPFTT